MSEQTDNNLIAIVGMSCRFPSANNSEQFWSNISQGNSSISKLSNEAIVNSGLSKSVYESEDFVNSVSALDDIEWFDAKFFGISGKEATYMDPQRRFLLTCAHEALESAGYAVSKLSSDIVGMYAGISTSTYPFGNLSSQMKHFNGNDESLESLVDLPTVLANQKDFISTYVSYKLNLSGPSLNINTACSTSLVSVHQACQSLLSYECDIALAGAATVRALRTGYLYKEGSILSGDGQVYAFDSRANGTVFGDGVAVVALKRFEEAVENGDTIHAVIRSSAINNDGGNKMSFAAPSVTGQMDVIAEALVNADINPEDISYIETHGTGTLLGDPIEVNALSQVYRSYTERKQFCAITSLKPNIGHLDAAAGVAGLIKTVEALKHQQLPPSINFKQANPEIDFENSPFYVNTELKAWPRDGETPRRAGVSSFGIGGTNAHVVLEEAPLLRHEESVDDKAQLLILSAKTETALTQMQENLSRHLSANTHQALSDVSFTLQVGRSDYEYRGYAVCHSQTGAIEQLSQPQGLKRGVCESGHQPAQVWMFSGQGTQYIGMSAGLYEQEPVFKQQLDECADLLKAHIGMPQIESDIRVALFAAESEASSALLAQTRLTQPILFAVEYSLAKLLLSWGLRPEVMIGHSLGEYVAACLAGVMSLPDALKLVSARGRLMQAMAPGSMLSVGLDEAGLATYLEGTDLSIAALNGRKSSVVSGPSASIEALEITLSADDVMSKRLPTSHAFHSSMMEGMLGDFEAELSSVELRAPEQRYVSNVTGKLAGKEVTAASYWLKHVREAVRFSEGIEYIHQEEGLSAGAVWLEVGPGMVLGSLVRQHGLAGNHTLVHSMRHSQQALADREVLLGMLGECWLRGVTIDWQQVRGKARRVPLPTYPFERERYWVDAIATDESNDHLYSQNKTPKNNEYLVKNENIAQWFYSPGWKSKFLPKRHLIKRKLSTISTVIFVDDEFFAQQLTESLCLSDESVIWVRVGESFKRVESDKYCCYQINPSKVEDYQLLFDELKEQQFLPEQLIHCWNVGKCKEKYDKLSNSQLDFNLYSFLYLCQNLNEISQIHPLAITILSNQLQNVTGTEEIDINKSPIKGAVRVINQEYERISCRSIDIDWTGENSDTINCVEQIAAEIFSNSSDVEIAIRHSQCWIPDYSMVELEFGETETFIDRPGVFLITGGLGGMGLTLAESLAEVSGSTIVLMSRSTFPLKEDWDSWLIANGEENPIAEKIAYLQSLENQGVTVDFAQADVSNKHQLKTVIESIQTRYGVINGVIHAAGIPGQGVMQFKTRSDIESVVAPKIDGTLNLHELIKNEDLRFFIMCSSMNAIVGGVGQFDYAAANAFEDAFALSMNNNRKNSTHFLSINWDAWSDVGMAVNTAVADHLIEQKQQVLASGISSEEGKEVFKRALANSSSQWLVTTKCLKKMLSVSFVTTEANNLPSEKISAVINGQQRPVLNVEYESASNDLQRQLVSLWQSLLCIEGIGVNDNFFDLGGDSILISRLLSMMKGEIDLSNSGVTLKTLFEYPTISGIAQYIEDNQNDQTLATLVSELRATESVVEEGEI
ncbi:acyl transferase domain-containing protein [Alteromonas sp. 76-1]|uniref:type I polyketide synthase n=1 Tax=Alteromonas sp. 76-1 TaxID=2358187 RepID=UPI000FD17FE2|nr:type I polyketide synthase [Alteromonas sp. 76-1]VEL98331.1 acyl transferase domain-containing protein [Alteromonas sp. 76-1]